MIYYTIPCLLLFCSFFYLIKEYRNNGITLVFMSLIWFVVIYCLAPIALISSYESIANKAFIFLNSNDIRNMQSQLLIVLFYMSFILGVFTGNGVKYYIFFNINLNKFLKLIVFLFLVGISSLLVFISEYGGLSYVISNLNQIRSGHADIKSYIGAFSFSFYKFINLIFFICLSKYMLVPGRRKFKFFLIINFILCIFGLYISAGRENAIAFFISMMVVYVFIRKRISFKYVAFFIVFIFLYVIFGKTLVFSIASESFNHKDFFSTTFYEILSDSYSVIMMEFSHQYLSIVNFDKNGYGDGFAYFIYYFNWLFTPLKLLGFNDNLIDSVSYYNTYIIMDRWQSIIPPGPVAFGYMNLGPVGIVIHGFIMGYVFRAIDMLFNINLKGGNRGNYIIIGFYSMLVSVFTYLMSNSDITLFIQNRVSILTFLIILFFYLKAKIFRLKY